MKLRIPTGPLRHFVRLTRPVRSAQYVQHEVAAESQQLTSTPAAEAPPQGPSSQELQQATIEAWQNIEAAIVETEERRQQSVDEMRLVAIEMAVAIAARVAGDLLEADAARISNLVEEAITLFRTEDQIAIALNPDDLTALETSLDGRAPPWGDADSARLKADPRVAKGSCEVVGATFRYVSRMGLVLDEIRTGLLESLEYAQVERRKTQTAGDALKRFPDRRETA